jgi:hypothetical protein
MKNLANSKCGEVIGGLAFLVPFFAFLLYIEVVTWAKIGLILAAALAIGGANVVLSGLFAHGTGLALLRGKAAWAFWGGLLTATVGTTFLLWFKAYDALVIGGFGLLLISAFLAFARRRPAGDA